MGKQYGSVLEMLRDTQAAPALTKGVENAIEERKLARTLFALRCRANVNQQTMAERMGCSQSKVSKIENSRDCDLSFGDIMDYSQALNLSVGISLYPNDMKVVDKVKECVFNARRHLDELVRLAGDDEKLKAGAENFHFEALINFARIVADSAKRVRKTKAKEQNLRVSTAMDLDADDCPKRPKNAKRAQLHGAR